MAEHAGEKSFEATPHRRQEAREKGQVVFSQDLGSAAMLMLGVLLLMMLGGGVIEVLLRSSCGSSWASADACRPSRKRCCTNGCASPFGLAIVLLPILG